MALTMTFADVQIFEQNASVATALPERCFLYGLSSIGYSVTINYSCDQPSKISAYLRFYAGHTYGAGAIFSAMLIVDQREVAATTGSSITVTGTYMYANPYNGMCHVAADGRIVLVDPPWTTVVASNAYVDCSLYEYLNPAISAFSIVRCTPAGIADDSGTRAKIAATYAVSPIDNNNTKALVVKYREAGEEDWDQETIDISALGYSDNVPETILAATFAADKTYEVRAELADLLNTTTNDKTLAPAYALWHMNANKDGIALGKYSEGPGFDVGMDTIFRVAPTIPDFANRAVFLNHLGVQFGKVAFSVGAESQVNVNVTYPIPYSMEPTLTIGLYGGTTGGTYHITAYIMEGGASATGAAIRIVNSQKSTRAGYIHWIAVGNPASG